MSILSNWLKAGLLSLLLLAFTFCLSPLHAQSSKAVFSTGGSFNTTNNLVKLYSYAPGAQPVVELARKGDFSNAVLADGGTVYFHVGRIAGHPDGGDLIMRYDLVEKQVLDSVVAPGTQRMAVSEDFLIVSRGFGADSGFVQVYDKNNLAAGPVFQDSSIGEYCLAVMVTGTARPGFPMIPWVSGCWRNSVWSQEILA
ncbi:MAG: hypothetical protein R3B47_19170 [Bacteroidia bacterium]